MKNKKSMAQNYDLREAIIEGVGLAELSPAKQDTVVAEVIEGISANINEAVWEKLSREDKNDLNKIASQGPEDTLDYLNSHIENFSSLVEDVTRKTIAEFKQKKAGI
ncbi:MAG: hypothetical protein A3D44_02790 [Candidatus Staskawiczbacteria bacterium RIFCSPHIGHO2_02_FULL_42_22]|uniref:Uncharacterized protein n=1 Tax=Candidatus Staskawiczbacteria bacterium RIFCSPHIGHO2_02_FULL_42_22 TaxID=1802207 RepID=A0A1G2I4L4_9BACT|nr:MAG: hypothetical protein A3D44_02790 [Candidatus Staskawiczbacteria bacterium RIFCSPHIGHO2_02_FULL_42_22]